MVAAPVVGDDAGVLAPGTLEPEAVPFKQLVLPRLNEDIKFIEKIQHIPPV